MISIDNVSSDQRMIFGFARFMSFRKAEMKAGVVAGQEDSPAALLVLAFEDGDASTDAAVKVQVWLDGDTIVAFVECTMADGRSISEMR